VTSFEDLGLGAPMCRAVATAGYTQPTAIQQQAIPHIVAGTDVLGIAQTGTGKTAAFALPMIHRLAGGKRAAPRRPRALVLAPTRELAVQIEASFSTFGPGAGLRSFAVFGGVSDRPQIATLARGIDILVATPGRLLDLVAQKAVALETVEILVLDEADRMLDMGFVKDVKKIAALVPIRRQTLLFSATMPAAVSGLAGSLLAETHARVEVAPVATTAERIEQRVLFVARENKRHLLTTLVKDEGARRTIVFARTKHGANRVAEHLCAQGVQAEAIHGNKSQSARQRALEGFRSGRVRILVATDIAARGIDIDDVTHVINFELPNEPESYVHRIGRTARAGRDGVALALCDADEVSYLRAIEKTIRQPVPVDEAHPFHAADIARLHQRPGGGGRPGGRPGGNGGKPGSAAQQQRPRRRRPETRAA
jgi:ATP-dependent RNA helicase RhlE